MKSLILLSVTVAFCSSVANAARIEPCASAVEDYAVKQQREDYPGHEFKKHAPELPQVEQDEVKANGFEIYQVSYTVDKDCLGMYSLLVRRSQDGKSCAIIKTVDKLQRDCG